MKKYVFYAHSGSENHGCEAIVRSSIGILEKKPVLYSINSIQDKKYGIEDIVEALLPDSDNEVSKYSWQGLKARFETKLFKSINQAVYNKKSTMLETVESGDIWFSIGGDNYCYPGTDVLAAENYLIKKGGGKTVLWGCSVEPTLINEPSVATDLSRYDLITVRESISYEAIRTVNKNTILVSDPAFTLKAKKITLPEQWIEGDMVGINVSPLILNNSSNGELVIEAYAKLIEYILNETDAGVALIPHVVWKNNDDREPLNKLYCMFPNTDRLVIIDDCDCETLKGYIAQCRFFIGARTHATIAAYSSYVPTLVLGYSVKSRGIAKDLFGEEDHYVIPVQELKDSNELIEAFQWIERNEQYIKKRLFEIMPQYINNAYIANDAVNKLLD